MQDYLTPTRFAVPIWHAALARRWSYGSYIVLVLHRGISRASTCARLLVPQAVSARWTSSTALCAVGLRIM